MNFFEISNNKEEFIKKQSCFSKLTPDETTKLTTLFHETHFLPGDTIVTEGEPVDSVFIIIKGSADVRHITIREGAMHIESIATLHEDDAIGLNETGFYSLSGVRTATVVALTEMITLKLNVAEFHGFALTYPHVNEIMRKNSEEFLGKRIF